jgi:hypothetical protein
MVSEGEFPDVSQYDLGDTQPWDRQVKEPSRPYAAFRLFRDLPPHQRRLDKIAEQAEVQPRTARQWAQEWAWWDRAQAWDDACHAIDDGERLDAIRAMHKIHRQAGRAAVVKAIQALNQLRPESMPPVLIARLLDLGAKLERSTLIVSIEELQGLEELVEADEDPWERIARELDPRNTDISS